MSNIYNWAIPVINAIALKTRLPLIVPTKPFARGQSDFSWLKEQALDQSTLDAIDIIERDERNFIENDIVTNDETVFRLNLKQGVIHTTRRTSHSVANLFVQIYEMGEHMRLREFVEGADVILDVGANEGYYALSMLSHNPKARVICVEPNPIALELLKMNIHANKVDERVQIVEKALWSSSGEQKLSIIPQATSIGAINPIETNFALTCPERLKKIRVATTTPADLFKDLAIDKIDILKMDIEGGELEVLKAFAPLLPKVNRIVLEYHSQDLRRKIVALLNSYGFKELFHISDREHFGDLYFEQAADL